MKKFNVLFAVLMSFLIFAVGCSSTVKINSTPGEAKVFIDGEYKGVTPYVQTDKKPFFDPAQIKITKEGFEDFQTELKKDEFSTMNCIAGVFLWVPFLWVFEYTPEKTYELKKK